ncbi:Pro-Pol polyprotein [Tetrabaena socialis]|uniref:Pro-Pol polyprotein n=1 Tax=Tetrabaena socialis TaxID=47790 RepID=A0A2J7ZPF5_9CHLO|nr:Pro-Pol polyprotein [Tetrabaena socialis]|eukprot:PNH02154.1 Pro-Pol polyprotein [Tetrabaena socialis]
MRDLIGSLQRLQPRLLPAYLIETAQPDQPSLGRRITIDQAQLGRPQHAVASYWTNLAVAPQLQRLTDLSAAQRDHNNLAAALPCRRLPLAGPPLGAPYYPLSIPGSIAKALPPGELRDIRLPDLTGCATALTANEVEGLLGLDLNSSAGRAHGSPDLRLAALANSVSIHAAAQILAFTQALQRSYLTPHHMANLGAKAVDPESPLGGCLGEAGTPGTAAALAPAHTATALISDRPPPARTLVAVATLVSVSAYTCTEHVALLTDALDAQAGGPDDVWEDAAVLKCIRTMEPPPGLGRAELKRVVRRAAGYRPSVVSDGIVRVMANGSLRPVPPPAARRQLIEATHLRNGHFGTRRTCALLQLGFWWHGMSRDVAAVVRDCKLCDRANAVGNVRPAALHPLPVMGPFYRWGVDLAGPLPLTKQGNVYVMIAIEHYSKHVELIPLPDKTSACTAQAFLQNVLARFSAPAEVVTDQGTEFLGEFDELLQQCFIDHRKTSANHPQADGAAERMVQLVKRGLRKYCESRQAPNCWDLDLPWLALGYRRCSPQASTLHSPYQLLYGVEPVVPPGMRERLRAPLDDQDAEGTWALLRTRGDELRRCLPAAAGNLAIAQHRDRRRYATLRSGSYVPRVERFEPGDYVYVLQRNRVSTLQLPTLDMC